MLEIQPSEISYCSSWNQPECEIPIIRTARVSAPAMETKELVVLREFQHAAVLYIKRPYWIAEVPPRQALAIRPR